jgi:hypothetical protein
MLEFVTTNIFVVYIVGFHKYILIEMTFKVFAFQTMSMTQKDKLETLAMIFLDAYEWTRSKYI